MTEIKPYERIDICSLKKCPPSGTSNVDRLKYLKRRGAHAMTQMDSSTENQDDRAFRTSGSTLGNKCAVVFGAGGSLGAAVAKEFAAEGARVFMAGRTKASLEAIAKQVTAGGEAEIAVVDALDDAGVNLYLDEVVKQAGKIDIVIDLTGPLVSEYGNGKVAVELPIDEFMTPLTTIVRSRFITARAAARHMISQRSGVIIFVTGSPARPHVPGATAIGAAFGAIENFTGNLAFEVSPFGVRVVCLRTVANIDSRSIQDTMDFVAGRMNITKEQAIGQVALSNFLKVPATVQDTANAAVLIASDRARMMTGTVVNASAGAALD
jgi:NAD(P)-dependent dehydrogenase (short-subunit alcohol dehydrogenase family)